MAHKPRSFRTDDKKKTIVIYTNIEEPAEKELINRFLDLGYKAMFEEKKPSKTIKDMKKELKADKEAFDKFEEIYKSKDDDKGFFAACKFYADWKKSQKKK